jgi:hypothetical protein
MFSKRGSMLDRVSGAPERNSFARSTPSAASSGRYTLMPIPSGGRLSIRLMSNKAERATQSLR